MRTAFTKPPYDLNLTWESLPYTSAEKLLNAFVFRSLGFCLAVELEADIWVVEWRGVEPSIYQGPAARKKDPNAPMRVCAAHQDIVKESDVPWDDYDVIISHWPSIGAETIKRHPQILWCYYEIQHRCRRSRIAGETGEPHNGYDLYLDCYFDPDRRLQELPQVVWFPYLQSPTILREIIKPALRPAVFIESRHVLRDVDKMAGMCAEFERICGLPMRYAPVSGATSEPICFDSELTRAEIVRTRQYLRLLGQCKYFLIWRGDRYGESKLMGESAVEAAALGLIVVGNDNAVNHKLVCHPTCLIPAGGPPRRGLRRIQQIEKDEKLQGEILEYQDRMLRKWFWDGPLETLYKALEMKKGHGQDGKRMVGN